MATFSREDLIELGFQEISDDYGTDFEYVLDPDNWVESDYLYSEKTGINQYRILQYNDGKPKELDNKELYLLIGTF